jgi:heptosyltransferase-2
MTSPALQRLREAFPGAHITLLGPEKIGDLWWQHACVDEVLLVAPDESLTQVARAIRNRRFDLGLVFPNSPRSALELFLGGVPRRLGYATPWRRWLLTDAIPVRRGIPTMAKRTLRGIESRRQQPGAERESFPASAHQIHHYLHLVARAGASPDPLPPRLVVTESETAAFLSRFLPGRTTRTAPPLLGLNPGAEYGPAKRWPEEAFLEAALAVAPMGRVTWLVFGGSGDRAVADRLAGSLNSRLGEGTAVNLAGATSLRELMAGLKLCRAVLTNDTGPMHVAAALGTPVVVPFGSTSPELTGPGLPGDPRHRLLLGAAACAPCFLRECPTDFACMRDITVDRVVAAVRQVADLGACGEPRR